MGLKLGGGVALHPGMTSTGTTTVMRPSAKVTTPISTFSFSGSSVPCGPLPCAHRVLGCGCLQACGGDSSSRSPRPKAHCLKDPSMSAMLARRPRKALKQFHLTMHWHSASAICSTESVKHMQATALLCRWGVRLIIFLGSF